jgi:hypothetical protein
MKNLHILQTDKPSRLVLERVNNNLFLTTTKDFGTKIMQFQNIYITSDEEIKDEDSVIESDLEIITQAKFHYLEGLNGQFIDGIHVNCWKKIILTTNVDLINDGVQSIDDEFLEWFVKNPSCEEVEVILDEVSYVIEDNIYKINIPIEEPKQTKTK